MKAAFSKTAFILATIGELLGFISGFGLRSAWTETRDRASMAKETAKAVPGKIAPAPQDAFEFLPRRPAEAIGSDIADIELEIDYGKMFAHLDAEGLRLVPKSVLFHLVNKPIGVDGSISPTVAEALQLSPSEVHRIEMTLKAIAEDLAAVEMERVEKISAEANDIIFRIHPFPADGEKLHERLRGELIRILGDAKGNSLVELIDRNNAYFDGFGAAPLEGRFRVVHTDNKTQASFTTRRVPEDDSVPNWIFHWHLNQSAPVTAGRHSYLLRQLPPEIRVHYAEPQ